MLTERGEVSEELVRNILGLAQSRNGTLEIPRVPQDDRKRSVRSACR